MTGLAQRHGVVGVAESDIDTVVGKLIIGWRYLVVDVVGFRIG